MNKAKVLVIDDSAFMRKLISDFLKEEERIEVVGTARNGEDGLKKIEKLQPDVVTMDVEMPVMDGMEALKRQMEIKPLPIIMLSSTTKAGAETTMLAMHHGAFDFIAKPSGSISLDLHKVKEEIIAKVLVAASANMKELSKQTAFIATEPTHQQVMDQSNVKKESLHSHQLKKMVVIGTSTGGPRALQNVLASLPKGMEAPVLIVQHMPPGFTRSLADRLDSICAITVKEAEDGELLRNGTAYIAPGGYHMTLKSIGRSIAISLDQTPPVHGHRPSVDNLFLSASELSKYPIISIIMTGMGSDGTVGLKALKQKGKTVAIAESAETSIVYGMPKAAVATNLVDDIVPLENIASTVMKYMEME